MKDTTSLRDRLFRFLLLCGALGVVTGVIVITQRLSQESLALLVGLTCGTATMLLPAALGLVIWRREASRREELVQRPVYTPQLPVIIVAPGQQALPGPAGYPLDMQYQTAGPRTFTVIGEE